MSKKLEKRIQIRMDEETQRRLEVVAEANGLSASGQIRHWIHRHFFREMTRQGRPVRGSRNA